MIRKLKSGERCVPIDAPNPEVGWAMMRAP
jgi:hypothetical protein